MFEGLSSDELDDMLYRLNAVKKKYRKGEIVVHAGIEAERLLVVASGHLHVYTETDAERHVLVREIGINEVLGLWIMHVPEVVCWPGSVVAAEDSVLISLGIAQARRLPASAEPPVAHLSSNTSKILAQELFSTWRKLMVMDAPTIESRVMVYLAELDNESGHTGQVAVPFDRERMAEYLGVTRPALSRALSQLRDRGAIAWRKNIFRLRP